MLTARVTVKEEKNLKGFADVTIANKFVVKGIRIMEGQNGLFLSMPSKSTGKTKEDGKPEYQDTFFPINKEARTEIETVVLDAYKAELAKTKA